MTTNESSSSELSKRGKPSAAQAGRTASANQPSLQRGASATLTDRKPGASKPAHKAAATHEPPVSSRLDALPGDDTRPEPAAQAEPDAAATDSVAAQAGPDIVEDEDQPEPERAPRLPTKAEIFAEGDHVVYPTHGVGKVDRIATEEIAGHKLELIHITFEENRMTLRVPVAKARSAGLRKLATRKMFDEALVVLKGRARVKRTMWSRRAQEYEAKINSGDPLAIAEVVRDLHRNAGQPDQSFSERQIYEAAMDRLAAELAALDQTDKATAAVKLADFLKTV